MGLHLCSLHVYYKNLIKMYTKNKKQEKTKNLKVVIKFFFASLSLRPLFYISQNESHFHHIDPSSSITGKKKNKTKY